MDLLSTRQKLVTANIANADTPGYLTKDIDFQTEFESLVSGKPPAVNEVSGLPARSDGNNVNLDREARLLAENALRFNVASSLVRAEFRAIRLAAQEGRGA